MQSYSVEAVLGVKGAKEFTRSFERASSSVQKLDRLSSGLKSIGKRMTTAITLPVVAMGTAIVTTGAKFDDQLSTVQAVTGATAKEMKKLREQAKEMGRDTRFSATQAAEGQEMLARAGFETKEVIEALPSVLNLAAAGAVDLGDAADIASNILSGFGMEATETAKVADILAKASSDSNTDIQGLGESMKYVAPIASDLGVSIEDTTAAIGFLGDAGIQGGQAGRQLRSGLQSLAAPTESAASLMEELGINVFDAEGNMKSLPNVVNELEKGLKGMSRQQRTAALETLFGSDAMSAWAILVENGSDELGKFSDVLSDSEGAAGNMAETMEDNLAGSFRSLKSALEGVMIEFYELGDGPIKDLIDWVTKLVRKITELDKEMLQWIAIAAGVAAAIGPIILVLGGIVSSIQTLIPILGALLSPVSLVVVAITGLTSAIIFLWNTNDEFKAVFLNTWENIKETFSGIIDTIAEHVMAVFESLKEFWDNNIESFLEVAETVFIGIWEIVETAMSHVQSVITRVLDIVVPFVQDQLEKIAQFWDENSDNIMKIVDFAFSFIKGIIDFVMPFISDVIATEWETITGIFDVAIDTILGTVEFFVSLFTADIEGMKRSALRVFNALWNGVKTIFNKAWNLIARPLSRLYNNFKDWFTNLKDKAVRWGRNMITGFADGISEKSRNAVDAAKGVVDDIAGYLKFWSPAKKGEGRGIVKWGANMVEGFLDGVESQSTTVKRTINNLTKDFQPALMSDIALDPNVTTSIEHDINHNSQGGVYEFNIEIPLDGRTLAKQTVRFTAEELEMIKVRDRRR